LQRFDAAPSNPIRRAPQTLPHAKDAKAAKEESDCPEVFST
jgi:hypothetical protein